MADLLTPLFHCPTPEAQLAAIHELYALGQNWEGFTPLAECLRFWEDNAEDYEGYAYLLRDPGGTCYRFDDLATFDYLMREGRGTLVNSVAHAVEYLRRGGVTARTYIGYAGAIMQMDEPDEEDAPAAVVGPIIMATVDSVSIDTETSSLRPSLLSTLTNPYTPHHLDDEEIPFA